MRWRPLVAVAVVAVSLLVTVVVACSDAPGCKDGTLLLQVALLDTAPYADTITVTSTDADIVVDEKFPHEPNASNPGVEHIAVEVTFPGGYPNDKVVHLVVRALGGVTILGANTATIHLEDKCTVGSVAVRGGGLATDMGGTD
jgi:hypothetical protein